MDIAQESDLKLEIAHVLLIDVVGYSKLLVNEQIGILQTLNRIVRETPHFRDAETGGKLLRLPTGDGMALLFFDSPEAPVECALEISRAARDYPQLQLRMGAHSGPIKEVSDVNDRPNFAGAGINMAQRVLDCGDAGHILLSKRLGEDLSSYQRWHPHLTDLGECEVKHGVRLHLINVCKDGLGNPNLPEKVRLQRRRLRNLHAKTSRWAARSRWRRVALAAAYVAIAGALSAAAWFAFLRAPAGQGIAVLPFRNLSDEDANTYFAEGVQEEILTDLAKVSGLKVISRTSVMQYKPGADRNMREIAKALAVSHVLEGNVQRIGGRVRVHAQLIKCSNDSHVWADRFDGDLADVFAIQSEIAEKIVAELRVRLSSEERAAIEERPTDDLAAYDFYIEARGLIDRSVYGPLGKEELSQAVEKLTEAIARDPKFVLAYYQLAHAHDQLYLRFDHGAAQLAAAESAIRTLQRLRPNSGEAHLASAKHAYWAYRDYTLARRELEIARRLLPNDPMASLLTGYIDRREGRWEESTRNLKRALELDPRSTSILQQLSLTYFNQRRFSEMARVLDRAVQLAPDDVVIRTQRAAVDLEWRGDSKPLRAVIDAARAAGPEVVAKLADQWIELMIAERDHAGAIEAFSHLSDNGCEVEAIPFPRSWCGGLAARARGDDAAATAAFNDARVHAEKLLAVQPDQAGVNCVLGMAQAALGNKEEAVRAGLRAVELLPMSKDALNGPLLVGYLAVTYAWTGEKDLAIEQLKKATMAPSYWSYGKLLLHPYWDPLRGDPRFEAIVESLAPR